MKTCRLLPSHLAKVNIKIKVQVCMAKGFIAFMNQNYCKKCTYDNQLNNQFKKKRT